MHANHKNLKEFLNKNSKDLFPSSFIKRKMKKGLKAMNDKKE